MTHPARKRNPRYAVGCALLACGAAIASIATFVFPYGTRRLSSPHCEFPPEVQTFPLLGARYKAVRRNVLNVEDHDHGLICQSFCGWEVETDRGWESAAFIDQDYEPSRCQNPAQVLQQNDWIHIDDHRYFVGTGEMLCEEGQENVGGRCLRANCILNSTAVGPHECRANEGYVWDPFASMLVQNRAPSMRLHDATANEDFLFGWTFCRDVQPGSTTRGSWCLAAFRHPASKGSYGPPNAVWPASSLGLSDASHRLHAHGDLLTAEHNAETLYTFRWSEDRWRPDGRVEAGYALHPVARISEDVIATMTEDRTVTVFRLPSEGSPAETIGKIWSADSSNRERVRFGAALAYSEGVLCAERNDAGGSTIECFETSVHPSFAARFLGSLPVAADRLVAREGLFIAAHADTITLFRVRPRLEVLRTVRLQNDQVTSEPDAACASIHDLAVTPESIFACGRIIPLPPGT